MTPEPTARFVARRDHASARLGAESVVLDLRQGKYFGLNDVAARAFELLERPRTLGELRDALVSEYAVEPARCEADVRELVAELVRLGLVEIVGDAAP
jgi:hypothetical protein